MLLGYITAGHCDSREKSIEIGHIEEGIVEVLGLQEGHLPTDGDMVVVVDDEVGDVSRPDWGSRLNKRLIQIGRFGFR